MFIEKIGRRAVGMAIAALFLLVPGSSADAQTTATQKALESVKESVHTLVGAKDENNPNEDAFRTETFKKVVEFSIVEAKELKIKFIQSFSEPQSSTTLSLWRDGILSRTNELISYYETELKNLDEIASQKNSEELVREAAEKFRIQRENLFIPLSEEVSDFLLSEQQKESVSIAEKRWMKIRNDVTKLGKSFSARKMQPLESALAKSDAMIGEAEAIRDEIQALFREKYLSAFEEEETVATTSPEMPEESSATTTPSNPPRPSIRDLAGESLLKIKGAYQIFIEMSGLVRKLFM